MQISVKTYLFSHMFFLKTQALMNHPTEKEVSKTLDSLVNITASSSSSDSKTLLAGELEAVQNVLETVAGLETNITEDQTRVNNNSFLLPFVC